MHRLFKLTLDKLNVSLMPSSENIIFFVAVAINSSICYLLFGITGAMFGVLTVFFTNIIYQAKEESNNIFYIGLLLCSILLGGALGFYFKLSIAFYLFLLIFSYFYYLTFNKDVFIDRTIPFFVIFACMGTTLPNVNKEIPLSYLTGVCISLIILTLLKHKKYDSQAFKNGLFSKKLYLNKNHLSLRAFIYSFFLFLSLAIPHYFNLYRVYWAPLTFIVLLRPWEVNIFKTTCYRFSGSILGAIFILILFHLLLLKQAYIDMIFIGIVIFWMPTFMKFNYLWKTFAITVFVLLLIEEGEYWSDPTYLLPFSRIYETLIGGSTALVASLLLRLVREH